MTPTRIAAVDMMVLFNSTVNPFMYALLNHRFRQNIKRVIWRSDTLEPTTGGKEKIREGEAGKEKFNNTLT